MLVKNVTLNNAYTPQNRFVADYSHYCSNFKMANDCVCFSSRPVPKNIVIEELASRKYEHIYEALMAINGAGGPLVENITQFFHEYKPNLDFEIIKNSVINLFKERAKVLAKFAAENPAVKIFIATDKTKQKIVGVGVLLPIGRDKNKNIPIYELCNLGVSQDCQGQGIGELLFNRLLHYCEQQKASVMAKTINPAVKSMFAKRGFSPAQTQNHYQILKALGTNYPSDLMFFRDFNIENSELNNIEINTSLLSYLDKAWPDWAH